MALRVAAQLGVVDETTASKLGGYAGVRTKSHWSKENAQTRSEEMDRATSAYKLITPDFFTHAIKRVRPSSTFTCGS